jgi:hypothetical protein
VESVESVGKATALAGNQYNAGRFTLDKGWFRNQTNNAKKKKR